MTRLAPGALAAIAFSTLIATHALVAQDGYRTPPDAIARAALASPPPSSSLSPTGRHLVLVQREAMPTIDQLARPMRALAGVRIDPARHARFSSSGRSFAITIVQVADGASTAVDLPADANVSSPIWTADGKRFAFTNRVADGLEVWVCDVASSKAKRIDGMRATDVLGSPLTWLPDQSTLLVKAAPRGDAAVEPASPTTPSGPNVQQTTGRVAPVRTYQDLLRTPHDEALFEHFARCTLMLVKTNGEAARAVGTPGLHASASPSPDGRFLLVTSIVRPFSYLVTSWSFPRVVRVLDLNGNEVHRVAELPLADEVPIGGVLTGPRGVRWIPTEPATLCWAEALDGGDPKAEVEHRDQIFVQAVGGGGAKQPWFKTPYRFSSVAFDETGEVAFATTRDRARRWTRTWLANPRDLSQAPTLWHERAQRDAYGDIGSPVTRRLANGQRVVDRDGDSIFLRGSGSSPTGDRPFLHRVDLNTREKTELFRCADGRYETVVAHLDDHGRRLLISRQSPTEPPNMFVVEGDAERQLTHYVDEQQTIVAKIERRLLRYQRDDGVELSATLYLPPGHDANDRLPTLVWAYPREFVSKSTAGQFRGSPYRYERLVGTSPLLMVLAGYAVLDDAAMPVVGPKESANDTFVEQLVAGAKAAIDAGAEAGVTDPDRCAIAGHSYGAFMTANLLAHSDLFRAGVARSGAYNRSLTPFGFQNERRTFWEAPEIYFAMSPFMHAPKIDEPLLMIHGEIDNNSGTFPIQSKRLYHAIKGHGGIARLVMLPHESHGYRARESVMHVLAESVTWLDEHVKNAPARAARDAAAERGK